MTKEEAIAAMREGKKVAHRYFSPDEWITMKAGKIETEEGYRVVPAEFWNYREQKEWQSDWVLYTR